MKREKLRWFTKDEFHCNCRSCRLDFEDMDEDFVKDLDKARGFAQVPFKINSSIRCRRYNEEIPEASRSSSHLKGVAVDIACPNSYSRYRIVQGLKKAGINRIGIGEDFVHADIDPDKPKELMWLYSEKEK